MDVLKLLKISNHSFVKHFMFVSFNPSQATLDLEAGKSTKFHQKLKKKNKFNIGWASKLCSMITICAFFRTFRYPGLSCKAEKIGNFAKVKD